MSKRQKEKREMRKEAMKRNPDYCRSRLSQIKGAKMSGLKNTADSFVVALANQIGVV